MSRNKITDEWNKNRHKAHIVWAHKLDRPISGCVLLNHWKQQAVYLTEYDIQSGARGVELSPKRDTNSPNLHWIPLALETELKEGKWQPIQTSQNIISGEIFKLLPPQMRESAWELLFLLLLSPESDSGIYQTLFDTGLSPRQGFFAYLRLLEQMLMRAETLEGVPSYRKIFETDMAF